MDVILPCSASPDLCVDINGSAGVTFTHPGYYRIVSERLRRVNFSPDWSGFRLFTVHTHPTHFGPQILAVAKFDWFRLQAGPGLLGHRAGIWDLGFHCDWSRLVLGAGDDECSVLGAQLPQLFVVV